ncbi:MAG: Glu-tRNA(Gln) amidotransferase subunit GatE [Desulfurococcales archaeon]|nr:Glu-tRNA(Gln) amidotransferase subunit GatE [Desulfurococcales archaeon]
MADELDFTKLGLKVGLEIHQQLDTEHKLFCNCPTKLAGPDTPIEEIERYLKVTKSEVGEIDPAALYEIRRGRKIIYQVPKGHACLVELDEEPPHELNREALKITIAIAKALHSNILDEIYVMRKIVVDGSNTTGFQRTAIVAVGGYIEDEDGRVGIQTICVEEDAARKVDEGAGYVKYNLDRLGIPLIEISTAPDIRTPEQAMRVALKIGLLMRLTGKVKRGIGTIRQDLNISIAGGEKIEIKGVSKLELIPKVIKYEVQRQLKLMEIKEELIRRGVKAEDIKCDIVDVTDVLKKCKSKLVQRELEKGSRAYAVGFRKLKGILGIEVQPNRRFGTELSDYAKAWGGVSGIIHSDELPKYGITEEVVNEVYKYLGLNPKEDAFVIVLSDKEKAERGLAAVVDRVRYALVGIPKETRGANPDGTTRYLRPQPGAARMYPETDVPPLRVDEELLKEAELLKPKTPEELLEELNTRHGLSRELATQLIKDPSLPTYLDLVKELGNLVKPQLIATTLLIHVKGLKSEGLDVDALTVDDIRKVLEAVGTGKIAKEAVPEVLAAYLKGKVKSVEDAIKMFTQVSPEELEILVRKVIEENKSVVSERGMKAFGLVMGRVMSVVRGRVDGKLVASIVKKILQEYVASQGG